MWPHLLSHCYEFYNPLFFMSKIMTLSIFGTPSEENGSLLSLVPLTMLTLHVGFHCMTFPSEHDTMKAQKCTWL